MPPWWAGRGCFARCQDRATWIDQLQPACGAARFFFEEFFFEEEREAMQRTGLARPWLAERRPPAAGPGEATLAPRSSRV